MSLHLRLRLRCCNCSATLVPAQVHSEALVTHPHRRRRRRRRRGCCMCRVVSLADAIPCLPALDRLRGRQSPARERAAGMALLDRNVSRGRSGSACCNSARQAKETDEQQAAARGPGMGACRRHSFGLHAGAAACVQARCCNARRTNVRHVVLSLRAKGDGSLRH